MSWSIRKAISGILCLVKKMYSLAQMLEGNHLEIRKAIFDNLTNMINW